jgi:ribose transport system substrate-binding protein
MPSHTRRGRRCRAGGLVAAALMLVAGCGAGSHASGAAGTTTGAGKVKPLKIVYFASATANGFSNAVWKGMQAEAKALGGDIELQILDGNFDPTAQANQVQDAAASKRYDGAVVLANDTVGIVPSIKSLIASGTVVSNVLNPLGPDLRSLKPQVDGLLNVIADPGYDTTLQAKEVATYCADKPTCRVVILIGGMQYPFDKARYDAYRAVLDAEPNIKVIASGEGNYDRDQALTAMADILQAHPDFDVLLSATDQETLGAQVALRQAGYDLKSRTADGSFYINSLGGSREGIAAVRAGEWNATVGNFPGTAGKLAIQQVVKTLRGGHVERTINLDEAAPVPLLLTADVLSQHADFMGEWSG